MSLSSSSQDLDLSMLYEIADGSNEFIVESIDMFLQYTPELLNTISASITANDWPVAAAAAHKLKPNLGFFGMPLSQAAMQEVEIMAKSGNPDPDLLQQKFDDVSATIGANIAELKKIKAELEG